jgi:O-antigen/teichoic acid export membrane protein
LGFFWDGIMARESGIAKQASIQESVLERTIPGLGHQAGLGVLLLGIRQIVVQGSNLIGSIVLARLLSTEQYGIYAIVGFSVAFLTTFGDAGLAASLVRQTHEPSEADYQAVFTAQQILIAVVTLLAWVVSPSVSSAYRLPEEGVWLFRLLAVALLVTSFQTMSVVKLERKLDFFRLSISEALQAVVFNVVVVLLTLKGMGIIGFGFAVLVRAIVSTIIIFLSAPWKMSWYWDFKRIQIHLKFGIPYQGITLISLLKDSISPIFVGLLINSSAVGQLNWAQTLAAYPAMALMLFQRVYLPVFSKLQMKSGHLGLFLSQVIVLTNAIVAPLAITTLFFAEPITRNFFGEKWLSSLPLFYPFWIGSLVVPTITPIFGAINAIGNSKLAFGFAFMWMTATWLFGAPLTLLFGVFGYASSSLGVLLTNYFVLYYARSITNFKLSPKILQLWLIAFSVNAVFYLFGRIFLNFDNILLATYLFLVLILYTLIIFKFKILDLKFLSEFR